MIKKFLLSVALPTFFLVSQDAFSQDMEVKLKGGFDFQGAYYKTNAPKKGQFLSANNKNYAFNSSANIAVDVSNKLDSGFKYGARIAIQPTTNNSRKLQSTIYTESKIGRLELGTDKTAGHKMKITPYSIASATAGLWDVYAKGDPIGRDLKQIPYVMNYGSFLDGKMRESGKNEYSRKITYYTPLFNGFQFGISYVPDSSNVGYQGFSETPKHTPVSTGYRYAVRNGFSAGLTYQKDFCEDSFAKISFVGETGQVKAKPIDVENKSKLPELKPRKLRSYNIGGQVQLGQYSFAATYANFMKSMTFKGQDNSDTHVYGLGAAYKYEKFSTSVTYFASKHRNNKISSVTLGADYLVAPGLLPYAEVTYFNSKGRQVNRQDKVRQYSQKGVLVLVGTRVEF